LRIELLKKNPTGFIKREGKYLARFFKSFSSFLYTEKGYYDCYVSSVYKVLRAFFNYLLNEKYFPIGSFHKLFKVPVEQSTPIILEPGQLQFLIKDKIFENSLPFHLRRTKDIFVFGCIVGLRYSDLMRLTKDNLIKTASSNYLLIHTKKTGTEVKLPLPHFILSIIDKYKRKAGKYLLPRLSGTNLNLQVKKIAEKALWTYSLPKIRFRFQRPAEIRSKNGSCLRFCDQVTAHTMRRTAITTLLSMGVPELVVRRISGHTAHSKEFYRYVVIAQDYLNSHVLTAYENLLETATKPSGSRRVSLLGHSVKAKGHGGVI
jgi:integrase